MSEYNYTFTVFTPTYERALSIHRVYESLCQQSFTDFEWIIVDDGSTDNTKLIVNNWIKEAKFPIRLFYQKHSGKHIAWNRAVRQARGKFFVIADSDDRFNANTLEKFVEMWNSIPFEKRGLYRGVACRCKDETGKVLGKRDIKDPWLDASECDAKYKYKYQYEMWGMTLTRIMREYPNPEKCGLRFYPESIIWDKIGEKYLTRYFNEALRIQYHDQTNATTVKRVNNRFRENYFLWLHVLNDLNRYLVYNPLLFLKSAVGIMRDGLLSSRSYKDIISGINEPILRMCVILLSPIGQFLYIYEENND